MVGHRQGDGDLAIVLLAELTAILTRYPYRVPALLRKPRIIDDPRLDRPAAFNHRQDQLTNLGENLSSDQGALATKCSSDWCWADTRVGAVTAAIGSTLLRSPSISSSRQ